MPINPLRLAASLLLAASVAIVSYQVVKPETFSYIKLRDGVVKEGGTLLAVEDLEEEVLTIGGWSMGDGSPIEGLIPWSEAAAYVGQPLARRVTGGLPLMKTDVERLGESSLEQGLTTSHTAMSIPVDNVLGVTPHIAVGERVHLYASFEDDAGAHSGLLLRDMPVIAIQREQESEVPKLVAVTISLKLDEAVLLTHALHYGKIRLGKAGLADGTKTGVGDAMFAAALMKTRKRWSDGEEVQ